MKQTITLQLAKLRKRNGITQRQLAEELGTLFQNINYIWMEGDSLRCREGYFAPRGR